MGIMYKGEREEEFDRGEGCLAVSRDGALVNERRPGRMKHKGDQDLWIDFPEPALQPRQNLVDFHARELALVLVDHGQQREGEHVRNPHDQEVPHPDQRPESKVVGKKRGKALHRVCFRQHLL